VVPTCDRSAADVIIFVRVSFGPTSDARFVSEVRA